MKKIGIDARLYFQTGVGVYLQNLLHYLQKIAPKDWIFYIYVLDKEVNKISFKNKQFIKQPVPYRWHSFHEQFFAKDLHNRELDLVHFTYFTHPILYNRKFIATIHDFTLHFEKTAKASTKNPLLYNLKLEIFKDIVLPHLIKKSQSLITPTQTVKNQIEELYGLKYAKKTTPIYEGVDYQLIEAKEDISLQKKFPKDFFLYVGNFYPHKNIERLILAFSQIKNDVKLVLRGPDDFFAQRLKKLIEKLEMQKTVVIDHNYSKDSAVFFYKHAKALIHPSISEGFGLPLVEAAYFNCPIIASDIPVFKEILGQEYLSFDPYDVADIKEKIENFMSEETHFNYKDLAKKYSFEEMAKQTLEIYKQQLKV